LTGTALRYRDIHWVFSHRRRHSAVPGRECARTWRRAHPMMLGALTRMVPISQILWIRDFPFRFGAKGLGEYGVSVECLRHTQ
jgi:hypothetical protein